MVIADRQGANPRQIPLRGLGVRARPATGDAVHNNNPVWSPDGEWVYFASGAEPQNEMDVDVWRVRPSGGPAERMTNQHAAANYPVVIDPTHGVVRGARCRRRRPVALVPGCQSQDHRSHLVGNRSVHVDLREPRRPADGRECLQPELEPVARAAARSCCDRGRRRAVRPACSDGMDAGAALQPRHPLLPVYRRDRRRALEVTSAESLHVWRDVDATLFEPAAVSPDGRELAVVVRRDGKRTIWLASAERFEPPHAGRDQSTWRARRVRERSIGRPTANGLWPVAATPTGRRCSRSLSVADDRCASSRGSVTTRYGRRRVTSLSTPDDRTSARCSCLARGQTEHQ